MLLSELVLEGPKDTGYFATRVVRRDFVIEVWSDKLRTDYDLYVTVPSNVPFKPARYTIEYLDLEPLVAQCVFFELLEKYPEK